MPPAGPGRVAARADRHLERELAQGPPARGWRSGWPRSSPTSLCLQETKLRRRRLPGPDVPGARLRRRPPRPGPVERRRHPQPGRPRGRRRSASPTATRSRRDEARILSATCGGVRVASVYVPNGRSLEHEQYQYKLEWLDRLARPPRRRVRPAADVGRVRRLQHRPGRPRRLRPRRVRRRHPRQPAGARGAGPTSSTGASSTSSAQHHDDDGLYSWWDYRAGDFHKHRGHAHRPRARDARRWPSGSTWSLIDRNARKGKPTPSDHAPVVRGLRPVSRTEQIRGRRRRRSLADPPHGRHGGAAPTCSPTSPTSSASSPPASRTTRASTSSWARAVAGRRRRHRRRLRGRLRPQPVDGAGQPVGAAAAPPAVGRPRRGHGRLRLGLRGTAGLRPRRPGRGGVRRVARPRADACRPAGHDRPAWSSTTAAPPRCTRSCASRAGSSASKVARRSAPARSTPATACAPRPKRCSSPSTPAASPRWSSGSTAEVRSGLEVVAHGVERVAQHRPDLVARHAELLFEGAHRPRRPAVEPEAA